MSHWISMAGTVAFAVTAVLAVAPKGIDILRGREVLIAFLICNVRTIDCGHGHFVFNCLQNTKNRAGRI